jgi:hypothetical protein
MAGPGSTGRPAGPGTRSVGREALGDSEQTNIPVSQRLPEGSSKTRTRKRWAARISDADPRRSDTQPLSCRCVAIAARLTRKHLPGQQLETTDYLSLAGCQTPAGSGVIMNCIMNWARSSVTRSFRPRTGLPSSAAHPVELWPGLPAGCCGPGASARAHCRTAAAAPAPMHAGEQDDRCRPPQANASQLLQSTWQCHHRLMRRGPGSRSLSHDPWRPPGALSPDYPPRFLNFLPAKG